jgi:hypothetical protein
MEFMAGEIAELKVEIAAWLRLIPAVKLSISAIDHSTKNM